MKVNEKLIKPITETAYLTEENTPRYRPIMRLFYEKHEQAENWLYKEDVFQELKDFIPEYTMEKCQNDLDYLVSKLSLTTMQDTENANTLEKFKYKNYRYQMSDYAIEIERLTIRLEELEVKVASLEPRLFERIKILLKKLIEIDKLSETDMYELWSDLIIDFDNLNFSYQDFLKKFNEPKTEDLLKSEIFIEHKRQLIHYLNDFINEYLKYSKEINNILLNISDENVERFMDSLIEHQKKAPKLKPDFDFEYLRKINQGKWNSLRKWFTPINGISEGDRLLKATENIISKITKYASNLIELHGNMINRKEEYKYLCKLFDKQEDFNKVKLLSSAVIGVDTVRHFKGISQLESDSIIPSLEVKPIMISIDPMTRGVRQKQAKIPVKDKTIEKEKLLERYQKEEARKQNILTKFIGTGKRELKGEIKLSSEERRYVFTLIEKAKKTANTLKGIDPVFGKSYFLEYLDEKCQITSEDGIFIMNGIRVIFEDIW